MNELPTGQQCQCGGCGLTFGGLRAFDMHRTGKYAKAGSVKGTRRCLTPKELVGKGLFENPLTRVWSRPRPNMPLPASA